MDYVYFIQRISVTAFAFATINQLSLSRSVNDLESADPYALYACVR